MPNSALAVGEQIEHLRPRPILSKARKRFVEDHPAARQLASELAQYCALALPPESRVLNSRLAKISVRMPTLQSSRAPAPSTAPSPFH